MTIVRRGDSTTASGHALPIEMKGRSHVELYDRLQQVCWRPQRTTATNQQGRSCPNVVGRLINSQAVRHLGMLTVRRTQSTNMQKSTPR
jgi:hypothetical protein